VKVAFDIVRYPFEVTLSKVTGITESYRRGGTMLDGKLLVSVVKSDLRKLETGSSTRILQREGSFYLRKTATPPVP